MLPACLQRSLGGIKRLDHAEDFSLLHFTWAVGSKAKHRFSEEEKDPQLKHKGPLTYASQTHTLRQTILEERRVMGQKEPFPPDCEIR